MKLSHLTLVCLTASSTADKNDRKKEWKEWKNEKVSYHEVPTDNQPHYWKEVPLVKALKISPIRGPKRKIFLDYIAVEQIPIIDPLIVDKFEHVYGKNCGNSRFQNNNRVFGGEITSIEENPWQVYFHISAYFTAEELAEKKQYMDKIEELKNKTETFLSENEQLEPEYSNYIFDYTEFYEDEEITTKQFLCGGTIISESHVITAAHCSILATDINHSGVVVGITDITIKNGGIHDIEPENWRNIQKIYKHEEYNDSGDHENDISILVLSHKLVFNEKIYPICLPTSDLCLREGHKLSVSGWGENKVMDYEDEDDLSNLSIFTEIDSEYNVLYHNVLRKVQVPIEKIQDCIWTYSFQGLAKDREAHITNSQICAGGVEGEDACTGDSGGPLTLTTDNIHEEKRWNILVGIVSWADGCGEKDVPTVYTRVSSYLTWIEDHSGVRPEGDITQRSLCYDTQYSGPEKLLSVLNQLEVRIPDEKAVNDENHHILADYAFYDDAKTRVCATKANLHHTFFHGGYIKTKICDLIDLSGEWNHDPIRATIKTAGLSKHDVKWCWEENVLMMGYNNIILSECRSKEDHEIITQDVYGQDEYSGTVNFLYDPLTFHLYLKVSKPLNIKFQRRLVSYNMWNPSQLRISRYQPIHFGSYNSGGLINEHGNIKLYKGSESYFTNEPKLRGKGYCMNVYGEGTIKQIKLHSCEVLATQWEWTEKGQLKGMVNVKLSAGKIKKETIKMKRKHKKNFDISMVQTSKDVGYCIQATRFNVKREIRAIPCTMIRGTFGLKLSNFKYDADRRIISPVAAPGWCIYPVIDKKFRVLPFVMARCTYGFSWNRYSVNH